MYLDLYVIKQLSYNIINYKKIINTFYNNIKLKIREKYEYFKYSIKYILLIKKIAKENNIIINKNIDNINYIFLNNNLQETDTDSSKTLSIVDSHLFKTKKIDGENINSISLKTVFYSNNLNIGFVLKRYSHDKGYRYLKYIKYYNINGDVFKLDISSDKIKIKDITKFYFQKDFNSIIIVGDKLTYGEKINNSYIIKVFTLINNVIYYNSFIDLKPNNYKYKQDNNTPITHTVIDTIDVSALKELSNVKDISISIKEDGIQLLENNPKPPKGDFRYSLNVPNLNKKCFIISYNFNQRWIRAKTIKTHNTNLSCTTNLVEYGKSDIFHTHQTDSNTYDNVSVSHKYDDEILSLQKTVTELSNKMKLYSESNKKIL